jgi:hypothetical protein
VDAAIETLLQLGLPGVVILGLAVAYWRERGAHHKTQAARVDDAQAVMNTLLEHDRAWQQTVEQLRMVLEAIRAERRGR